MLPFSVDKIIMDMMYDMNSMEKNIVENKYKFCCEFEKELSLEVSEYSQNIFDYIFNLFKFRRAVGEVNFKKNISDLKDLNFINSSIISDYIQKKYVEFVLANKNYFMDYFGFKHEDDMYIARKIGDNKNKFKEKLLEFY